MARMLGLASLWTLPLGMLSLGGSDFAWPSALAVAGLGIVGTGVAFVLMGHLVARVGSRRASFATYLIPVVALILGVVFRDEAVHLLSVIGIGLVIAGPCSPHAGSAARERWAVGARRRPHPGVRSLAPTAVIEPSDHIEPMDIPPHAVLCFFQDVIEKVVAEHGGTIIDHVVSEIGRNPIYELDIDGRRLALVHPGVGAPLAGASSRS